MVGIGRDSSIGNWQYTGCMRNMYAWLAAVTALAAPLGAHAQAGWVIERFASDMAIEQQGSVLVRETIRVDFGSLEKHGIYRDVPIAYRGDSGNTIYTDVSEVDVMQDGVPAEVSVTHTDANMRIRIGDPDRTISGAHEYAISYRVAGVLRNAGAVDELYWNVTGNEWEAPIEEVEAIVRVPATILQTACYSGAQGATGSCGDSDIKNDMPRFLGGPFAPGEGMTIAVGYEAGIIPIIAVSAPASLSDLFLAPLAIGMGGVIWAIGSAWMIVRWWKYGRDRYWQRAHLPGERSDRDGKDLPERILPLFFKQPVVVEYDPPDGLRPAEIGVLMDERADTLDVSATIVDLASRGYLTIIEVPKKWVLGKKDYTFSRTEKRDDSLLPYERELLKRLFEDGDTVSLSDLKNTFTKHLAEVKSMLYEEVVHKKLFHRAPNAARSVAVAKGLGMGAAGIASAFAALWWFRMSGALHIGQQALVGLGFGLFAVQLIALFMSGSMPRKTGYGRELYERSRGYELFVSGTEKHRARFYEDEGLFMAVLPYAIMFGVTDKLAKAFREMGIEPRQPSWFHGATAFNVTQFSCSMESFSKSLSTTMASSPSGSGSSGGGFSGGGFGGGGGGSW